MCDLVMRPSTGEDPYPSLRRGQAGSGEPAMKKNQTGSALTASETLITVTHSTGVSAGAERVRAGSSPR
jgi:hypothetical protein